MLLVDIIRDNFERLFNGDEPQDVERERTRRKGLKAHRSKQRGSKDDDYSDYRHLICSDELDVTSTESLSTSSYRTQGSSDHHWLSSDDEEVVYPRRSRKECSLMSIDAEESSAIAAERSKKLPGTWYYSSNHIMVNNERTKNSVHPLTRKHELDAAARWHAANMAAVDTVHHPNLLKLQNKIGKPCRVLCANIARGQNIRAIHNRMMESRVDVKNMLDKRYLQFGMGTATGPNGDLFLCQVYRG